MKTVFYSLVLLLLPVLTQAHPSVGLVCNSKGVLFYTDLEQVWRLEAGKKTIAVPHVHTHELCMDAADNLYGKTCSMKAMPQTATITTSGYYVLTAAWIR